MAFAFTARDSLGKLLTGSLDVPTRDDAALKLRRDGLTVVELNEEEDDGGGLFPKPIRKNDIIYTTSQLSIMVDTGITLSKALSGIADQEENATLKTVLVDLKNRVESGESFSESLGQYPKLFDKTFVSLVKASEETGSLGAMLDRIATYMRKELETRSKVRGAMAYPAVMAFVAVAVVIFMLTYILPKFEPLFSDKGVKLPAITQFLMVASDALLKHWYWWLAGISAVVTGYVYAIRTEPGKKFVDLAKLNLPVLGPLSRKVCLSRSIRSLGTMLKSGVSVLDALKLCADISGNYHFEQAWKKVLDDVTQGHGISESLRGNKLFPRTLIQMIGAGEESGKLDVVLEKVSNHYDQEVEMAIKTATSLVEPIMICVMGVVVGGIAMGLLLPIFQLSKGH